MQDGEVHSRPASPGESLPLAEDSFKLKGLRRKLVRLLQQKGICDPRVLEALEAVPRHQFLVDDGLAEQAYDDRALPLREAQTISQPYTVAYMSEHLQVQPGQKVLEIGTGSGYQAAILSALGGQVYSVERVESLHKHATRILKLQGHNVKLRLSDGTLGWKAHAPYDRIITTAGAPSVPGSLLKQLANNGRMLIPVGDQRLQHMVLVTKDAKGTAQQTQLEAFQFVPLKGKEGW